MSRTAVRVGCWRRRVTGVLEEWPSRLRACLQAIQNPAYRLAGFKLKGVRRYPRRAPAKFLRGRLSKRAPRSMAAGSRWLARHLYEIACAPHGSREGDFCGGRLTGNYSLLQNGDLPPILFRNMWLQLPMRVH